MTAAAKAKSFPATWTMWHLLAFWAIWFSIASGISWIIIGGAMWRLIADHVPPTPSVIAGSLSRTSVIVLAIFWSLPVFVAVRWSYSRIARPRAFDVSRRY